MPTHAVWDAPLRASRRVNTCSSACRRVFVVRPERCSRFLEWIHLIERWGLFLCRSRGPGGAASTLSHTHTYSCCTLLYTLYSLCPPACIS